MLYALMALAIDPAILAPDPAFYQAQVAVLESRVADARAIGEAAARLQNAWIEDPLTGRVPRDPCKSEADASIAARSVVFTAAYRDATQSARAQLARVQPLVEAPTLKPLLAEEDTAHLAELSAKVEEYSSAVLQMQGWQAQVIVAAARRCPAALTKLDPAPGLERRELVAHGEDRPGVAVIGLDGSVKVLVAKECDGTADCAAVAPGAVLGP